MAIERMDEAGLMEDEAMAAPAADEAMAQIPLSLLGGATVNPGDIVKLEVVDVDDEGGMVNVRYASPSAETETPALGVEALGAQFGE